MLENFLRPYFTFVRGKPFQPSIISVCKAGTYPIKNPSGAPPYGKLLALPTNNRLGWKGTMDKRSSVLRKFEKYRQKRFYNIGFRGQCYKTFYDCILLMFVIG